MTLCDRSDGSVVFELEQDEGCGGDLGPCRSRDACPGVTPSYDLTPQRPPRPSAASAGAPLSPHGRPRRSGRPWEGLLLRCRNAVSSSRTAAASTSSCLS